MKFALLSAIAAGAALVQVGASPLRVVLVTSSIQESPSKFRFGHAVSNAAVPNFNPNVATMLVKPNNEVGDHHDGENQPGEHHGKKHHGHHHHGKHGKHRGKHCGGGRLRMKMIKISNAFRKALGWPLIETNVAMAPPVPEPGHVRILPFVGNPPIFVEEGKVVPHPDAQPNPYIAHPRPHHHHHHHEHGMKIHRVGGYWHRLRNAPFMERLHVALTALGPWEGRAVAFVFGCGIGVLLRMFWVLAIVSYRMIRGPKEDENKYTEILVVESYDDAEEVAPAPPTYTYSDEKADKDKVAPAN